MAAIMDMNQLSSKIISAAIEVHKSLGPSLLESTYGDLCKTPPFASAKELWRIRLKF
jgi:hypothetical protein